MRVVLLHDEIPPTARLDELDALVQADAVAAALSELGHTSERVGLSLDLRAASSVLRALAPDVVFNLVESVGGQGRLIHLATALLDALGVPYTGCPTAAMFITSGKLLAKRFLHASGIATPPWLCLDAAPEAALPVPGQYIIKSAWEHASVGMNDDAVVNAPDVRALERVLRARQALLGGEVFAEAYIDGREFNLSLLAADPSESGATGARPSEPVVLPPAEIHFEGYPPGKPRVVGYRAKWESDSFEYHHTPRCFDFPPSDARLLDELCALARRCWALFGLRGYARVDFRVDQTGRPWILEINTNPCLSPDAGFPAAAQRAGVGLVDVVRRILADVPTRRGASPSVPACAGT